MSEISKTSMKRITSYTHSQFIGCTKLQIKQEELSPVKMLKMTGGSVVYVNPELTENYPMLAQTTQGGVGITGWIVAFSAAATAASHWGDELSLKQREVIDPVFVPVF